MARRRSRKPKAPKKVAYTLLTRVDQPSLYKALDAIVKAHHHELKDARIALAWCTAWRADVDGRQTLGQCKRATDLDRELAPFDFVILLQKDFWTNEAVTNEQRDALLDHELCHATVKLDPYTHEPVEDERGHVVYRIRKHDLEEFSEIAERHGTWKRDLEHFAQALARSKHGEQARLPMKPSTSASMTH
jgi:Putative phage metallopeptidase